MDGDGEHQKSESPLVYTVPVSIYRLPPDRYSLLPDLPAPEHSVVMVAEHEGQIIGRIVAERSWVVSAFEVERKYRGTGLAAQIVDELIKENTERLAEYLVTTSPHVDLLVYQKGFHPLLGQLWVRRGSFLS